MHLLSSAANIIDQADDPVHFAVGLGVDQLGTVSRPVAMYQHFVARTAAAPQFFGDEGHDWMQHQQALVDHPGHGGLSFGFGGGVFARQQRF